MTEALSVIYRIRCAADEVETVAKDIALEQTVEVPEALVSDDIMERVVGKTRSVVPDPDVEAAFLVTIDYPAWLAGSQIPQFLNLVYGNISLKPGIRLQSITFPDSFLQTFPGPNYGIQGIRERLGVFDRPLLATAIKPKGSSDDFFAGLVDAFGRGGGDIIKDDHNLQDPSFDDFCRRVMKCQEAALRASDVAGKPVLYFPNVIAPSHEIDRYFDFLMKNQFFGLLISPMVVGLDTFRRLVQQYPLCYMAHPTFTGGYLNDVHHGLSHGFFLGTFFRMMGADSSIFPNYGGRFTFSQQDCHDICNHLRAPFSHIKDSFPAPAGGMKYANVESMAKEYGVDTIFLIGGALLSHSRDVSEGTKAFLDRIREFFDERVETPKEDFASACELPSASSAKEVLSHLAFQDGFAWSGREADPYKPGGEIPFKDVTRWELIGKHGEKTAFDLRYFEIEPGGYSSLEKHNHTHTVVCVRGTGVLEFTDSRIDLKHMDIAYVEPMQVHQLKNEGSEPFGFFCIVDHERDKPVKP